MSLYEELLNEKEVPVIFVDYNGIVTHVNGQFEESYSWPTEQLVGKPLSTIIPENLHDSHNMGFSKYMISGQPTILNTSLQLQIRLGNGEIVSAEHFIIDLKDHGQELVAAKITPLSD